MVGIAKITPRARLDGFDDVLSVGKDLFDWVSTGRAKSEEKELLTAQLTAQQAQQTQLLNLLKVGIIGAAVVIGLKYATGR